MESNEARAIEAIKDAATALTSAAALAAEAGLEFELEEIDVTTLSDLSPRKIFSPKVRRVEVLM